MNFARGRRQRCAILATLLMTGRREAQTYPSRAIRLVVPISAGSVTDVAARLTAQELRIVLASMWWLKIGPAPTWSSARWNAKSDPT